MAIIKKWKKYSLIIEGQLRYRDMYLYLLLSKKITNSSLYVFFNFGHKYKFEDNYETKNDRTQPTIRNFGWYFTIPDIENSIISKIRLFYSGRTVLSYSLFKLSLMQVAGAAWTNMSVTQITISVFFSIFGQICYILLFMNYIFWSTFLVWGISILGRLLFDAYFSNKKSLGGNQQYK